MPMTFDEWWKQEGGVDMLGHRDIARVAFAAGLTAAAAPAEAGEVLAEACADFVDDPIIWGNWNKGWTCYHCQGVSTMQADGHHHQDLVNHAATCAYVRIAAALDAYRAAVQPRTAFDDLQARRLGITEGPATVSNGAPCSCMVPRGSPDPACKACGGSGIAWSPPTAADVVATARGLEVQQRTEPAPKLEPGDVYMTAYGLVAESATSRLLTPGEVAALSAEMRAALGLEVAGAQQVRKIPARVEGGTLVVETANPEGQRATAGPAVEEPAPKKGAALQRAPLSAPPPTEVAGQPLPGPRVPPEKGDVYRYPTGGLHEMTGERSFINPRMWTTRGGDGSMWSDEQLTDGTLIFVRRGTATTDEGGGK